MDNSAEHEATESDIDHRLRYVDPLLVIPHEPLSTRHLTESALDDPATGQQLEVRLIARAADDLENEILIDRSIHQAGAVVGTVSEQMLERQHCLRCRQ